MNTKYAELVAGKILLELARPFEILNNTLNISASIGITYFPQDSSTAEELIKNADLAMYMAKHAGRNQFCFFESVKQRTVDAQLQDEKRYVQLNDHSI